jgi:hypothetical protein
MKLLARPLLWLLTTAIPVFIAACYGAISECGITGPDSDADSDSDGDADAPDKWSFRGTVRSAVDGAVIPYIRVSCGIFGMAGAEIFDATYTTSAGAFELWYSTTTPCDFLRFEDQDGPLNGSFAAKEIPFASALQDEYELEAQD